MKYLVILTKSYAAVTYIESADVEPYRLVIA